jgi:hypothetical protein
MKKLLPIILIVLVLGGLAAYLLTQNKMLPEKQTQRTKTEQEQLEQESIERNYTGTLKKIMGLGVSLKCTWSQGDNYSGTTWVKENKFYGEINSQGKTNQVIFKDDCMWTWTSAEEQGIKMCFQPEEAEEMISGEAEATEGGQTMPADVNYSCQPAVFTDAKFNPPSDIEFMDLDQMMQGMGQ